MEDSTKYVSMMGGINMLGAIVTIVEEDGDKYIHIDVIKALKERMEKELDNNAKD